MKINYSDYGLGLLKGKILLSPHNHHWKSAFTVESRRLHEYLPELQLEHIGSTAIDGIAAKPILDILGIVSAINKADVLRPELEKLGYEWKGEFGITGRRYCVLSDNQKQMTFVHLHIFEEGSEESKNHLKFRDNLNLNSGLRTEYEKLKMCLIHLSREEYTESKASFIQKVLNIL